MKISIITRGLPSIYGSLVRRIRFIYQSICRKHTAVTTATTKKAFSDGANTLAPPIGQSSAHSYIPIKHYNKVTKAVHHDETCRPISAGKAENGLFLSPFIILPFNSKMPLSPERYVVTLNGEVHRLSHMAFKSLLKAYQEGFP